MPRYMLDTDICSYIMKRSSEAVLKRLRKVPVSDVCISVITKSELRTVSSTTARRSRPDRIPELHRGSGVPRRGVVSLRQDTGGAKGSVRNDRC
jgi:predicted nucleic acid-binding protein